MVTMSDVWDRTAEILHARIAPLASIAFVTLMMPGLVRDALPLFLAPASVGFASASALVAIATFVLAIGGQLALLAIASDPEATVARAVRLARARFGAAFAVSVVALLVVFAAMIPLGLAVALSGVDVSTMGTTGAMPDLGAGTRRFVALYGVALLVLGLVAFVRLILTNAVVLHERRGMGAFRRSWQLTRGLAWRIAGAVLLYLVLVLVATSAAQFATGAIAGLLLDSQALAAFLARTAGKIVTTIFAVLATAFVAQLYLAVTERVVEMSEA